MLQQIGRRQHQVHEVCGVVADAGSGKYGRVLPQGQRPGIRKHHVRVGGKGRQPAVPGTDGADHVFCSVDIHVLRAAGSQPVPAEFRPQVLLPAGRRDPAKGAEQLELLRRVGRRVGLRDSYDLLIHALHLIRQPVRLHRCSGFSARRCYGFAVSFSRMRPRIDRSAGSQSTVSSSSGRSQRAASCSRSVRRPAVTVAQKQSMCRWKVGYS